MVQVQQGKQALITPPSWARLPHELLAVILQPSSVSKDVRLVCRSFRDAFDAHLQCATLRPSPAAPMGAELPRPPRAAATLRLDASHLSLDLGRLAPMLQRWSITAPLELNLSHNWTDIPGAQALLLILQSPGFAPAGLKVLNLCATFFHCGSASAELLCASPQLAALRELQLAECGLDPDGTADLCRALQTATHIRSLTLLDLSDNDLGRGGVAALAACLRAAAHLRSLQQLLLRNTRGGPEAIGQLARAIAEAQLPLTALDIRGSGYGDEGAAPWAAVLPTAACLAGLEVLELGDRTLTLDGMTQLAGALQAATHLTRLRKLGLLPDIHMQSRTSWRHVERFVRLLQAAPHIAASLEEIDFGYSDLSGAAWEAVCDAVLATGCQLTRLRRLDFTHSEDLSEPAGRLSRMCTALIAGTHLTGLQHLELGSSDFMEQTCNQLITVLSAAKHLSGLRALPSALVVLAPHQVAGLLHAAPHLRGLTKLVLWWHEGSAALAGLHSTLHNLPALRSLQLEDFAGDKPALLELPAVLAHAPCTPSLEELSIVGLNPEGEVVALFAEALRTCTRLCGLRCLKLLFSKASSDSGPLAVVGDVLSECKHLSGLRELQLGVANGAESAAAFQQNVCEMLSGGRLSGVRVMIIED